MTARLKPALIVLVAACRAAPVEPCPSTHVAGMAAEQAAPVARASPLDSLFQAAGTEFDVPPAVLKAIGWVETRWQMVEGREEFAGRPPVFGLMALGGTALERGAALAGVSVEAARRNPTANIRAAAALLRAYAAEAGGDWDAAAARFSGIDLPAGRAAYTSAITQAQGRARPTAAAAACPPPSSGGAPDYAAAVWRASPNFNERPVDQTGTLHMVIIHTCESNYASCWSWLLNPVSQASAHYVVDEEGGEISQLVREPDRAWHIAALYDCALNRRHDCGLNGVQSNDFTVGIEHAGFASQAGFPASQIEASATGSCSPRTAPTRGPTGPGSPTSTACRRCAARSWWTTRRSSTILPSPRCPSRPRGPPPTPRPITTVAAIAGHPRSRRRRTALCSRSSSRPLVPAHLMPAGPAGPTAHRRRSTQ